MAEPLDLEELKQSIETKELLESYKKYHSLLAICHAQKAVALSDKSNKKIGKMGLDITWKKKSEREEEINSYFDQLQNSLRDGAVIEMVGIFERLLFLRIADTTNFAVNILEKNYSTEKPFSNSIKSFVKNKGDINNLSGLKQILLGNISDALHGKLREIIDYRNRIAHGRRFGRDSILTVENILEDLDKLLKTIL